LKETYPAPNLKNANTAATQDQYGIPLYGLTEKETIDKTNTYKRDIDVGLFALTTSLSTRMQSPTAPAAAPSLSGVCGKL